MAFLCATAAASSMSTDSDNDNVSGVARGAQTPNHVHSSSGPPRISGVSGQSGRRRPLPFKPLEVLAAAVLTTEEEEVEEAMDFLEDVDDRDARVCRRRDDAVAFGGPFLRGGERGVDF